MKKRIEAEYPEDARASPPPPRGGYAVAYGFDVDEYDNENGFARAFGGASGT